MKKVFNKLFLAILLLFPISVFATGSVSVSPTSLDIEVGSSKTFTISAYNTIGDVSISSSNSSVASVSTGEWATGMVDEGQTKTGTITVTGKSVGTATITLIIDAATFDGDDLAGQTRTVTVNVVAKPTPQPDPTPNPPSSNNNTQTKSTNNKIKELSVDGYKLLKVDANNYTLSVGPNVDSINIKAIAEDSKAKVTGTGEHKLKNGENIIEIKVTSESGSQNKINIKVTKKENYSLEDLSSLLNNADITDVEITIDSNVKLTSTDINNIKNSGKKVELNYYDDSKKLLYSWILYGSKIKDTNEFLTKVNIILDENEEINKLANYANGIVVNFGNNYLLPLGTMLKVYVGGKYKDKNMVNIYYFNEYDNKLENISSNLSVEDGYITFSTVKGTNYFITMSNIVNSNNNINNNKKYINMSLIISIIEFIVIVGLLICFLKFKSFGKKSGKSKK